MDSPYVFCNNGRQWRFADEGLRLDRPVAEAAVDAAHTYQVVDSFPAEGGAYRDLDFLAFGDELRPYSTVLDIED